MSACTVLGDVPLNQLGRTITHEHLNVKIDLFYTPPPEHLKHCFDDRKITLKNLGNIRQYPYSYKPNIGLFGDESERSVIEDVALFKKYGGGTIVENTSHGLERNTKFLCKLSKETKVNIIAGTGYYVAEAQSASNLKLSVEQLAEVMRTELTKGCIDHTSVKCGFIGEVGSSWPIEAFEKRCIEATAIVQSELDCPVSFHPGRDNDAPPEIIRIYLEAGGKADKAVMSHAERTFTSDESMLEFMDLGTYCQFDLFGIECSYYQLNNKRDMPSDAQRMDSIVNLVQNKFVDKVLISHDIHTKHRLAAYGGHGYAHILNNVAPKLLTKGLSQSDIDTILIKSPATWLNFKS